MLGSTDCTVSVGLAILLKAIFLIFRIGRLQNKYQLGLIVEKGPVISWFSFYLQKSNFYATCFVISVEKLNFH